MDREEPLEAPVTVDPVKELVPVVKNLTKRQYESGSFLSPISNRSIHSFGLFAPERSVGHAITTAYKYVLCEKSMCDR